MPHLLSVPTAWAIFWAILYLGILIGSFALWRSLRRRRRLFPFKENVRLLRQPGEALLKHVHGKDEALGAIILFGYFVPILAGLTVIMLAPTFQKWTGWRVTSHGTVLTAGMAFSLGMIGSLILFIRNRSTQSNFYLGYCGERYVAEQLKPLELMGWLVFHDVPASNGKKRFNLDHVAIGPGGVSLIETKAPRKHARLETGHIVEFDGSEFRWPGGKRNKWGMKQTLDNAEWLREFFETNVGQTVDVMPILIFPSWYVKGRRIDPNRISVVDSTKLIEAVVARGDRVLSQDQIQLYGKQIERLCRDVEI